MVVVEKGIRKQEVRSRPQQSSKSTSLPSPCTTTTSRRNLHISWEFQPFWVRLCTLRDPSAGIMRRGWETYEERKWKWFFSTPIRKYEERKRKSWTIKGAVIPSKKQQYFFDTSGTDLCVLRSVWNPYWIKTMGVGRRNNWYYCVECPIKQICLFVAKGNCHWSAVL